MRLSERDFEFLRDWVDSRVHALIDINEHPNDAPRNAAILARLEDADREFLEYVERGE